MFRTIVPPSDISSHHSLIMIAASSEDVIIRFLDLFDGAPSWLILMFTVLIFISGILALLIFQNHIRPLFNKGGGQEGGSPHIPVDVLTHVLSEQHKQVDALTREVKSMTEELHRLTEVTHGLSNLASALAETTKYHTSQKENCYESNDH